MKMKTFFLLLFVCATSVGAQATSCSTCAGNVLEGDQQRGKEAPEGKAAGTVEVNRRLSEAQLQAIKSIRAESEKKAAPVALRLAATVRQIYENMLAEKPDEGLRGRLSREMREETWELLSIKGESIREVVNALTPEQKRLVRDEMAKRGAPADLTEVVWRVFKVPGK